MVFGVLVLRIASVGNAEVGCTLDLQERNSEVGGPALAKGQRHADLLTLPGDRQVVGAAVIAAGVVLDVELVGHEVAVLVQHHVPVEAVQRQHVQVLTVVERPLGVGVHDVKEPQPARHPGVEILGAQVHSVLQRERRVVVIGVVCGQVNGQLGAGGNLGLDGTFDELSTDAEVLTCSENPNEDVTVALTGAVVVVDRGAVGAVEARGHRGDQFGVNSEGRGLVIADLNRCEWHRVGAASGVGPLDRSGHTHVGAWCGSGRHGGTGGALDLPAQRRRRGGVNRPRALKVADLLETKVLFARLADQGDPVEVGGPHLVGDRPDRAGGVGRLEGCRHR